MQNTLNPTNETVSRVRNFVYASCAAYTSTTAGFALTSSALEDTGGAAIIQAVFTPTTTANKVRVTAHGNVFVGSNGGFIAGLFHSSSTLAKHALGQSILAGRLGQFGFVYESTVTSTTSQAYTIRVGDDGAGNTLYINGNATVQLFAGEQAYTIAVDEIVP